MCLVVVVVVAVPKASEGETPSLRPQVEVAQVPPGWGAQDLGRYPVEIQRQD